MIRERYSQIADQIVVDGRSNVLSIFSVIDEVSAPGFPTFLPRAALIFSLDRDVEDPEDYTLNILARLGDNIVFGPKELPCLFKGMLKTRVFVNFNGIMIPQAGELIFELRLAEMVLASIAVSVVSVASVDPQQEIPAPAPA